MNGDTRTTDRADQEKLGSNPPDLVTSSISPNTGTRTTSTAVSSCQVLTNLNLSWLRKTCLVFLAQLFDLFEWADI